MKPENIPTPYQGSAKTADIVERQIAQRWGKELAKEYDPRTNCMTYNQWKKRGYQVRRGEKSIRGVIYKKQVDKEKNVIVIPVQISLFYKTQVIPIDQKKPNVARYGN